MILKIYGIRGIKSQRDRYLLVPVTKNFYRLRYRFLQNLSFFFNNKITNLSFVFLPQNQYSDPNSGSTNLIEFSPKPDTVLHPCFLKLHVKSV
jgi:hypothetical protein